MQRSFLTTSADISFNETQAGRVRSEPSGDWPHFADDGSPPGVRFWLAMMAGGVISAAGFGWLIVAVL